MGNAHGEIGHENLNRTLKGSHEPDGRHLIFSGGMGWHVTGVRRVYDSYRVVDTVCGGVAFRGRLLRATLLAPFQGATPTLLGQLVEQTPFWGRRYWTRHRPRTGL